MDDARTDGRPLADRARTTDHHAPATTAHHAPAHTRATASSTPDALHSSEAAGRGIRISRVLLLAYALALAVVALWPVPVDRGIGGPLQAISAAVPWLSYEVMEFSANVLLFVPFGVLLALVLPRRRVLVVPIALVATLLIESAQALLLAERTPALSDILANTLGAALGLLIAVLVARSRTR